MHSVGKPKKEKIELRAKEGKIRAGTMFASLNDDELRILVRRSGKISYIHALERPPTSEGVFVFVFEVRVRAGICCTLLAAPRRR